MTEADGLASRGNFDQNDNNLEDHSAISEGFSTSGLSSGYGPEPYGHGIGIVVPNASPNEENKVTSAGNNNESFEPMATMSDSIQGDKMPQSGPVEIVQNPNASKQWTLNLGKDFSSHT